MARIAVVVASAEEFSAMMRTVLSERFRLVARYETRERPVYALMLDRDDRKLGPNIHPSIVDCSKGDDPPLDSTPGSPVAACTVLSQIEPMQLDLQGFRALALADAMGVLTEANRR